MNLANLDLELMKVISSDHVLDLSKHLASIQTGARDVIDVGTEINTVLLHACAEGALKCLQALLVDQYVRKCR